MTPHLLSLHTCIWSMKFNFIRSHINLSSKSRIYWISRSVLTYFGICFGKLNDLSKFSQSKYSDPYYHTVPFYCNTIQTITKFHKISHRQKTSLITNNKNYKNNNSYFFKSDFFFETPYIYVERCIYLYVLFIVGVQKYSRIPIF